MNDPDLDKPARWNSYDLEFHDRSSSSGQMDGREKMKAIRLTEQEIEIANMMDMPLQEYGYHKMKLELEREKFKEWLQTPAGVEYMKKRDDAYQKRLVRDREYSRAYRAKKRAEKIKMTQNPINLIKTESDIWQVEYFGKLVGWIQKVQRKIGSGQAYHCLTAGGDITYTDSLGAGKDWIVGQVK